MQIAPLPGPFGVAVTGLDLARDMSEPVISRLVGLLCEHQILVVRDQQLTEAEYLAFGRLWGDPVLYPRQADTLEGYPEIIRISNSARTPERYRDGAIHWHSDSSYEEVPAFVTMLYGLESPLEGGVTKVASTALAYDALPAETKQRIDGLTGLHCLSGSPALPGETNTVFPEAIARHGITRHPLVMTHPVTGRKSIFTSGTAFGAEGLEVEQGRSLITQLRAFITRPEFVTGYKLAAGDILLWDNYQTLHCASPARYSDKPGERRLIHRISTKGAPAFAASQPQ